MLLILFRRSHCRLPTGTPTRPIATAGQAYGQWHKRSYSFVFRLPPGVCKASATFTRLMVYMNSSLGQDFAKQSTSLGRMWTMTTITTTIYLHDERETDWGWGTLRVSDHPFQRRHNITDFYNPT